MCTRMIHLLTILALGPRTDGLNPLWGTARKAIKAMPMMGNETVGYFGGPAAFEGVDDVMGKDARDLKKLFGVEGKTMECPKHGTQPIWVGHIFPRAFGGVMVKGDRINLHPECGRCNEAKYTLLAEEQRLYVYRIKVKGFELD